LSWLPTSVKSTDLGDDTLKSYLLSTEQMFKDQFITSAMVNGDTLVFMNKYLHPILKAENRENGAYVCTANDLKKAFGDTRSGRAMINLTSPAMAIHHPDSVTAMLLEPTSNGGTNWAMPTITDGDMLSTQQQERAKEA
jgi:hypothetical protein